jgi:hypothetical protein
VTGRLDCTILNLLGDLRAEHPLRLVVVGEVGMVTSIRLDANSPALLGHAEDEGPSLFRIEVSIC